MAVVDELKTVATFDGQGLKAGLKSAASDLANFNNRVLDARRQITDLLVRSVKEAGEEFATFQTAARNFGGSFPQAELESFAGSLQSLTGVAGNQIAEFVGLLGSYRLTKDQAKQLAPGILDAAEAMKAQGITTEDLSRRIGAAVQSGRIKDLARLLAVDEAKFGVDRIGAIKDALDRFQGSAEAFKGTLPGAIQEMNSALGDARVALGQGLVVPMTTIAKLITRAAHAFSSLPDPIKQGATAITLLAIPALTALSFALKIAEARYHLLAAAAAKQGAASTAAAAQTATAATTTAGAGAAGIAGKVGAGIGILGTAGIALGVESLRRQITSRLGVVGKIDDTIQRLNPLNPVSRAFDAAGALPEMWQKITGGGNGGKDAKPPPTADEKTHELLSKIVQNTEGLAGQIGNREAEQALGMGRISRALSDKIGGRA